MGIPETPAQAGTQSPIEVIALKCRSEPRDDAVDHCRHALNWLKVAGAERFFWKYCSTFDSTPEGNIGPVAEMLMAELGTRQTIYCPAFPENGRTVYMGNLFVGEQPLAESPMKDHPLNPMRDSNLMRLLATQVEGKTGLVKWQDIAAGSHAIFGRLASLVEQGVKHIVTDTLTGDDLRNIAEAVQDWPLLSGGSAIAGYLPEFYTSKGKLETGGTARKLPASRSTQLVLSGSCSQMTRAQVKAYGSHALSLQLNPAELATNGVGHALAWLDRQPLEDPKLIYATDDPQAVRQAQESLGREKAGRLIETAMGEIAKHAASIGIRRFVIAGGETSGAVTQALGVDRLQIGAEICPGVPWTAFEKQGETFALALKSGNFGDEAFFDTAFKCLETA